MQVLAQLQTVPGNSLNPWAKPVTSIRKSVKDIEWPEVSMTFADVFPGEAAFNSMKPDEINEKIMTLCVGLANQYQLDSRSRFQVKSFGQFFKGICNSVQDATSRALPEYSQLTNLQAYIRKQLDLAYLQIYFIPNRENWKNSEDILTGYKNSIFGIFGLPMKYSFLIEQLLLISALGVALIGLRKK